MATATATTTPGAPPCASHALHGRPPSSCGRGAPTRPPGTGTELGLSRMAILEPHFPSFTRAVDLAPIRACAAPPSRTNGSTAARRDHFATPSALAASSSVFGAFGHMGLTGSTGALVRVTTSERDARKPHTRGDPISRRPREWSHSPPARLVTSRRSLFKNVGGDSRHRASLSRPSLDGKYFEDFERARARATQPCAHDVPVIRSSRRCTDDARTRPPLAPAHAQSGDGVRVSDHLGCG